MRGFLTPARLALPVLVSLSLSACDKDLQQQVDRLEAELRSIRSDTRETVEELKGRVIAAESKVGVSGSGKTLDERIALLEGSFGEILTMKSRDNEMVYLRANLQGHAPLLTDHGTFLVRMEGIDLNVESGGYTVHLNVGNPQAIAIQQFTLRGDHGGGTPELPEDEDYNLRNEKIKAWQETLKPFEYRVAKVLEPFSWTPFDIEIMADTREELEMIRFSMVIENAQLNRQMAEGGGSSNQFAHIQLDAKSASVLKTEYGAFLIAIKGTEASEVGTKVHLEIGNPYGFTLNQCRLIGDYGAALPARAESASEEEYTEKMQVWSTSLQPFESMISSKISNFRWNKTTILIPGPVENVKFLRCQLRVEDVTLPAATGIAPTN
ncbi:MAG: hypothetical protein NWR21_12895 [Verrucomicrobiales bacterium]|jgi:hypothetical protein|nr:hypothetical protein [Verrucomicrobiales bacterium]MDP4790637.1 hypothetical protein [Verrucomicrobiales bacterium]MDP4940201.1 hypothetical protein [Verrucomicrobiales bacterium]MDP5006823.1 hypothetical protein [Verrucomicrobiales bacterium]